jgi:subtilisin family serine protease
VAAVLAGVVAGAGPAGAETPEEPAPPAVDPTPTVGEDAPVEPGPAPEDPADGTETVSAVVITDDGAEVIRVEAAPSDVPEVTADLRRGRGVLSVSVDTKASIFAADPRRSDQWGLDDLALSQLSPGAPDGAGLLVAVVDTGVDYLHPDLDTRVRCDLGADFVADGGGDGCTDPHGHGTHVAGEISALSDNGIGISGVSNASIIPVRVLDEEGWGDASDIAAGIVHAVDQGAAVVNVSLGGEANAAYDAAVDYAVDNDVIVVAAAGNNRQQGNEVNYPAASPGAISVAATDEDGLSASFSYSGPTVDVSAPGTNILSTLAGSTAYDYADGTSMAAPLVAGVLVRLRQLYPLETVAQIESRVTSTAIDMENAGRDNNTGYGMIDTLELLSGQDGSLPPGRQTGIPGAPTLGQPTIHSGALTVRWTAPTYPGTSSINAYGAYVFVFNPLSGFFEALEYVTVSPSTRSYTFTGLINGRPHVLLVTAFNATGEGQWAESDVLTPLAPTAPATPTIADAWPGPSSAGVRWTVPSNNRSAIQRYVVRAFYGTTLAATVPAAATATAVTVPGLVNGRTYTFDVRAQNGVGISAPSARSAAVVPRTKPTAPVIREPYPGPGRATVRWLPPTSNGGAALSGYTIRVYRGTLWVQTVPVAASATSGVVTGLANGAAHSFTVYATNAAGTSPLSARSIAVTPRDRPGAPTLGTPTPENGSAVVRWAAPPNNGSVISSYTIRVYRGTTLVKTATIGSILRLARISGLTNGVTYTFTIAATNGLGASPASAAGTVTPRTVPGAPRTVDAVAGPTSATVTWTAPASNGGAAVTSYVVRAWRGTTVVKAVTVAAGASTAAVTGLTTGLGYTFTVHAVNAAGTSPLSARTATVTPT